MNAMPPTPQGPTRRCSTRFWAGTWSTFLLGVLAATILLAGGCDTPYTGRVRQLDNAYQQGNLSREDYMRFVHEAERWETR